MAGGDDHYGNDNGQAVAVRPLSLPVQPAGKRLWAGF